MLSPHLFRLARIVFSLPLALSAAVQGPASAEGKTYRIQGLFCNTEEQIDEALGYMSRHLAPRVAAALTNDDNIVCTYVDLLHYIVEQPRIIGEIPGDLPLVKYEGTLVGVVVGGGVRTVSPPVDLFFVTPQRVEGASVERRA